MKALKAKLRSYLIDNRIDRLFEELAYHLTPDSDLREYLVLLQQRYRRNELNAISGALSPEDETFERNKLAQNLLKIIDRADEDDFKKEDVKKSLVYFREAIASTRVNFETVTNQKANNIEKAGQSLMNLGALISNNRKDLDQSIPFHELLKSGSRKASRRLDIGIEELKEIRTFQNQSIESLIDWYNQLIAYLDFPDEAIDEPKRDMLRQEFITIRRLNNKLKDYQGYYSNLFKQFIGETANFKALEPVFDEQLKLSEQQGAVPHQIAELRIAFQVTFQHFDEMKVASQMAHNFFLEDDEKQIKLINQLEVLLAELDINMKENQ